MLKRQRPPSPPLPSSSIPFISDLPGDLIDRNSKRRRTLPPMLDGASRGWANMEPNFDDEEDEYSEEEDAAYYQTQTPTLNLNHQQSEYKSANTMLRELHTLHQHRLLFSPSTSTSHATSNYPSNYTYTSTPHLPHLHEHLAPTKAYSPPQDHPRPTHTPVGTEKGPQPEGLSEEIDRVTERYESTNKMLGSVFLSRRRVLDSSDVISGT